MGKAEFQIYQEHNIELGKEVNGVANKTFPGMTSNPFQRRVFTKC